ncbi:hypothetical protein, partial [Shewanella sp. MBTL60-007]|uniref:hypothetical protein n=1 Tax=Shewanella sp. MBTL60-007 TaxID=2815911 RepID=UPI001C81F424
EYAFEIKAYETNGFLNLFNKSNFASGLSNENKSSIEIIKQLLVQKTIENMSKEYFITVKTESLKNREFVEQIIDLQRLSTCKGFNITLQLSSLPQISDKVIYSSFMIMLLEGVNFGVRVSTFDSFKLMPYEELKYLSISSSQLLYELNNGLNELSDKIYTIKDLGSKIMAIDVSSDFQNLFCNMLPIDLIKGPLFD